MGRVKVNFFNILDKYEFWKGKYVKSVLGEFSSGVSICPNQRTRSDLGAPFLPGSPPGRGIGGPFLRLCLVYNFLIWYIRKIWYIFVRVLSWAFKPVYLVYYKAKTEKPTVVLKPHKKVQRFCLTWEWACILGKRQASLEESSDVLKKLNLALGMRF